MWKAFGRGFDSRRLHHILILCVSLIGLPAFGQENPITVFEGAQKSSIAVQSIEGTAYVKLADLQPVFQLALSPIAGNQSLSLTAGDHSVILSANRSLVSLNGKLVSLSQQVFVAQNEWFVPLDFISKVLKVISEKRILWLENSRSLILGDIVPNQVNLKYSFDADHSRLVFQSARPIQYTITMQNKNIVITPQGDDFLPGFQNTTFHERIIDSLNLQGKAIKITTGDEFGSYKAFDLVDPPRLVIDFLRKSADVTQEQPGLEAPEKPDAPTLLPSDTLRKFVVVIDPGHGGSETGATGPDGTMEKDVVMGIARKLKSILEGNGFRTILTRDGDQLISLDERTALANNNKADLFISIHANATLRGYGRGAETYFLSAQATDDEARNVAAVENNAIGLNQQDSNIGDDLKLILWDMAQTEYLAESSQLAETIQQEMNDAMGIKNRGIKQAPFRVLMGATMPAVLVEVGFINNPAEEKLMKDAEFQMKIARAISRSIQKFQGSQPGSGAIQTSSR